MNFDDFISKWTQKPVDFDGIYPNQCMDLMHQYIYDVLGLTDARTLAQPAAYQVYTNFDSVFGHENFTKIDNTPKGVPQKGDIVFFGQAIGNYGHVCIFVDGDANSFNSFDANWPTGSLPHIQNHTYSGCLGWLRFNGTVTASDTIPVLKTDFETLVGKSSEYDKFVAGGFPHLEDVQKAIHDKESTIQNLTKDLNNCETQNGQYLDQLTKLNDQDKNTSSELLLCQKSTQPLKDTIALIKKELNLFDDNQIIPAIETLKSSKIKTVKVTSNTDQFIQSIKGGVLYVISKFFKR